MRAASTKAKIAKLAHIPRASTKIDVTVNPGVLRSCRRAKRRSRHRLSSMPVRRPRAHWDSAPLKRTLSTGWHRRPYGPEYNLDVRVRMPRQKQNSVEACNRNQFTQCGEIAAESPTAARLS